ncbi:hypothetical protein RDWZM_009040 [Blomia tropicalis]|uniref:Uncharacterized protein n=1 Tax=Blomia tropicalis TaxID=40697 RepID=A0A9Q0RJD4_BLOTA|nr:hypothetical protein RDWZM_009040 [Blomia tropicalis]
MSGKVKDSNNLLFWRKSTYLSQGVSRNSDNKVKDEDSDNSVQLIDTQPPPTQECLIDEEEIFIKPKRKPVRNQSIFIDEADDIGDVDDDEQPYSTQLDQDNSLEDFVEDKDDDVYDYPQTQYLNSVRDLVGVPYQSKFKLKYDYDPSIDVYSQVPGGRTVVNDDDFEDEENEYEMDSFCNDEIIYEEEDGSSSQPIMIDLDRTPSPMRLRSSKTLSRKNRTSTPQEKMVNSKKRFRRVIIESPQS